jgi:hypothetical protein
MNYETYFNNARANGNLDWEKVEVVEMSDMLKQELRNSLPNGGEPDPVAIGQPWYDEFNFQAIAAFKIEDDCYYVVWEHSTGYKCWSKVDIYDDGTLGTGEPDIWGQADEQPVIKRDEDGDLYIAYAPYDENEMVNTDETPYHLVAQEMMRFTIMG